MAARRFAVRRAEPRRLRRSSSQSRAAARDPRVRPRRRVTLACARGGRPSAA